MATITYLRDDDGCLLRASNWLTDVWVASAQAWRPWATDWSAARVNEISRDDAQAIVGPDAALEP